MPKLQHNDRARFIGMPDLDGYLKYGDVYTVFGTPKGGFVSVRVHDPEDDFGGVLSRPEKDFEQVE